MRILHSLLTCGLAGTERYATDLCNRQVKNHCVALLVRQDHHPQLLDWLDPAVQVLRVPKQLPLPAILWHCWRWRPQVIHAHHKRDGRYLGRWLPAIPKVATLHMCYQPEFARFNGLICIARWQQATIAASFSAPVRWISNWTPQQPPVNPAQVASLRTALQLPEQAIVIGAVGRFTHEKGFDLLIEAFQAAQLPSHCYLVIVGDGPQRSAVLKHCPTRVRLPGLTGQIAPYYQLFDLFVLPSREESFGLVLLEAMAAGLPIIATDTLGPREILSPLPAGACLIDVDNLAQLTQTLQQRVGEQAQRYQYADERFEGQHQSAAIIDFYHEVMRAH